MTSIPNDTSRTAPDAIVFWYRNYAGSEAYRRVRPISIRFGTSDFHKEPQWLLLADDLEKNARREFAMRDISDVIDASRHTITVRAASDVPNFRDWPPAALDVINEQQEEIERLRGLCSPEPDRAGTMPSEEDVAKLIYAAFPFDEPNGTKPDWVEGGNSRMQDRARCAAATILVLLKRDGSSPVNCTVPSEKIARTIATELGETFDALPPGPHVEPEFTQDDFLRAANAVLALSNEEFSEAELRAGLNQIIA